MEKHLFTEQSAALLAHRREEASPGEWGRLPCRQVASVSLGREASWPLNVT